MTLINYEINIFLTWSEECIIVTRDYGNTKSKFAIADRKLCFPVVTLSAIVAYFFLIMIHSIQGWTATKRHGVTRKRDT